MPYRPNGGNRGRGRYVGGRGGGGSPARRQGGPPRGGDGGGYGDNQRGAPNGNRGRGRGGSALAQARFNKPAATQDSGKKKILEVIVSDPRFRVTLKDVKTAYDHLSKLDNLDKNLFTRTPSLTDGRKEETDPTQVKAPVSFSRLQREFDVARRFTKLQKEEKKELAKKPQEQGPINAPAPKLNYPKWEFKTAVKVDVNMNSNYDKVTTVKSPATGDIVQQTSSGNPQRIVLNERSSLNTQDSNRDPPPNPPPPTNLATRPTNGPFRFSLNLDRTGLGFWVETNDLSISMARLLDLFTSRYIEEYISSIDRSSLAVRRSESSFWPESTTIGQTGVVYNGVLMVAEIPLNQIQEMIKVAASTNPVNEMAVPSSGTLYVKGRLGYVKPVEPTGSGSVVPHATASTSSTIPGT